MGVAAVQGLHGGNTEGPSGYLPKGTIVSEAKHAAACEPSLTPRGFIAFSSRRLRNSVPAATSALRFSDTLTRRCATCASIGTTLDGFGGKDGMAADLSPRTLHDIYLRPWREYKEAGGRGAMLSHNSINDVPAHADPELMSLLRRWAPPAGVNSSGMLLASDMCDIGLLASGSPSNHIKRGPNSGFGVVNYDIIHHARPCPLFAAEI